MTANIKMQNTGEKDHLHVERGIPASDLERSATEGLVLYGTRMDLKCFMLISVDFSCRQSF